MVKDEKRDTLHAATPEKITLDWVPDDVIPLINSFLPNQSLALFAQTSKRYCLFSKTSWNERAYIEFGMRVPENQDAFLFYQQLYHLKKEKLMVIDYLKKNPLVTTVAIPHDESGYLLCKDVDVLLTFNHFLTFQAADYVENLLEIILTNPLSKSELQKTTNLTFQMDTDKFLWRKKPTKKINYSSEMTGAFRALAWTLSLYSYYYATESGATQFLKNQVADDVDFNLIIRHLNYQNMFSLSKLTIWVNVISAMIKCDAVTLLQDYLQRNTPDNFIFSYILREAITHRKPKIIQIALNAGADINSDILEEEDTYIFHMPLIFSIFSSLCIQDLKTVEDITDMLLAKGADPTRPVKHHDILNGNLETLTIDYFCQRKLDFIEKQKENGIVISDEKLNQIEAILNKLKNAPTPEPSFEELSSNSLRI